MYNLTENLLSDLTQARVGQNKCPVVLVGHSIGGLVIKELCLSARQIVTKKRAKHTKPVQDFLGNINGLFFYSTPHLGTRLVEETNLTIGCLFEDLGPLNKDAAQKREEFWKLCRKQKWRTSAVVEREDIEVGNFKGIVVPAALARSDMDELYMAEGNHFDICRPRTRNAASFTMLIRLIDSVMERHIRNAERLHKISTGLAQHPVGLQTRAEKVQELLKGGGVLGIFGMGGIGKTTLAQEVFNMMSEDFEYTCFVDNVKGFKINDLQESVLKKFHHKGIKVDGAKVDWYQFKGKETLMVMDDIDSLSQLEVLPRWQDFGTGSCLILTSRDKRIFKFYQSYNIYDVEFLDTNEATELFCKHAFSSRDIPEPLRRNVNAVVNKCGGLPLTLEVMGRYLRNKSSNAEWEDAIDTLGKATALDGCRNEDDKLWAGLELSYDELSKEAQDMFCDAATYFFEKPLDMFLAAWSDKEARVTWDHLVDRAMVKEVSLGMYLNLRSDENIVWVHEQLRDLATRHLKSTILSNSRNEKVESLAELLNENKVNRSTRILQLDGSNGHFSDALKDDCFVRLKHLKYMDINEVDHEGSGKGITSQLRLLRWATNLNERRLFQISLMNMNNLAVLVLQGFKLPKEFPEALGTLVNLRRFEVLYCEGPEGFCQALGNLKKLEILLTSHFAWSEHSLAENFGNLSELKEVALDLIRFPFAGPLELEKLSNGSIDRIGVRLPTTFGQLRKLKSLTITGLCEKTLGDGFEGLSSLEHLEFVCCTSLSQLPDSFGQLSALRYLKFEGCKELCLLPDSFGQLSALRYLQFEGCKELCLLPNSFGQLLILEHLEFRDCWKLSQLPDSFGQLSALRYLKFEGCRELWLLPESFGNLRSLKTLSFCSCRNLASLPESLGCLSSLVVLSIECCPSLNCPQPTGFRRSDLCESLSSLTTLTLSDCASLERLPASFGLLSSLKELELNSVNLVTLPENIGEFKALETLSIKENGSLEALPDSFGNLDALTYLWLECPSLQRLPASFGNLSALRELDLEDCWQLQELPESFGLLSSLEQLSLPGGRTLQRFPYNFGQLSALKELVIVRPEELSPLRKPGVESLWVNSALEELCNLSSLEFLWLQSFESVVFLPESLGLISSLRTVILVDCTGLQSLPDSLGKIISPPEDNGLRLCVHNCPFLADREVQRLGWIETGMGDSRSYGSIGAVIDEIREWKWYERKWLGQIRNEIRITAEGSGGNRSVVEPACHPANAIELLSEMVKEFLEEVTKGDKRGFLVSAEWFCNLDEHEKEVLMAALWNIGYSEMYRTSTTLLYERLDEDNADICNPNMWNNESSTSAKNEVTVGSSEQVQATQGIGGVLETEQRVIDAENLKAMAVEEEMHSTIVGADREANKHSGLAIVEKGKKQVDDPVEEQSINLRSFIATLKEKGPRSYYVSTEWLSSLDEHAKQMVRSVCLETGYIEIHRTSATTCYQRVEDQKHNGSTCNDGSNMDEGADVRTPGASARESEATKKTDSLPVTGMQNMKLLEGGDVSGSVGIGSKRKRSEKSGADECVSQRLRVTCTSPSQIPTEPSTSSQASSSGKGDVKQRHSDCDVTLPRQSEDHSISTTVQKILPVKIFDFSNATREFTGEDVFLKVTAESIVSCCLTSDDGPKRVHVAISKLRGFLEYVDESKQKNRRQVFLEAVRTNVAACIERRSSYENLVVCLDEDIFPRVVHKVELTRLNQTMLVDRVWLAISGINPEKSPNVSTTVELRCHLMRTKLALQQGRIDEAPVLLFQSNRRPVLLEGLVRNQLCHPSSLELDIRYQLQLSSLEPCESVQEGKKYMGMDKKTTLVDFDCVLEHKTNDLSSL
ncbi:unnamed protein product [Calypogeia fissa]